jgi:hypothetical protein
MPRSCGRRGAARVVALRCTRRTSRRANDTRDCWRPHGRCAMADAPYRSPELAEGWRDDGLPSLWAHVHSEWAPTVLFGSLPASRLAPTAARAAAHAAGVSRQAQHRLRVPELWHAAAGRAALSGVPGLLLDMWVTLSLWIVRDYGSTISSPRRCYPDATLSRAAWTRLGGSMFVATAGSMTLAIDSPAASPGRVATTEGRRGLQSTVSGHQIRTDAIAQTPPIHGTTPRPS